MGVIATYSYAGFQAMYPNLASIGDPTVSSYWNQAAFFHDNSGGGPVCSVPLQQALMNMMAAHLMVIFGAITINGDGSVNQGVVGRVNTATEGSVSVGSENDYPPGSAQWFQQTAFGSAYWQATAQFRTFLPVINPARRRFNPPLIGGGWWGGQR
jgi:hypothetical protein